MHVFITGASGWIGSAATDELLAAGHRVTGLARSDAAAAALEAKGARVLRGDLDDLSSIRTGAAAADAVIHLANKHDFADQAASNKAEREAVQAIAETLVGSNRPFLLASGVAGAGNGIALIENDASPHHGPDSPRGGSENLALDFLERGVGSVALRFAPTVHGRGDHGFTAVLVDTARRTGVAGYVGEGANRWPAVARSDAGRVVRLALEQAKPGTLVHVIGEEGVPTRAIAEAIGAALNLPVASIAPDDAVAHFGWLGGFFAMDIPASSDITRQLLNWTPTGPTLIEDLENGVYTPA